MLKISLITATLGRVKEVKELLDSLVIQTYKDFELIIVDQNEHFELEGLIKNYQDKIEIKYIRSGIKGLSFNRNIGIKSCSGEIIAFPDDDCFYSDNLLNEVTLAFNSSNAKLALVEAADPLTQEIYIPYTETVNRKNIMKHSLSCNIFIRNKNYFFDETIGVGTYFSSGEETDFLWEQMKEEDNILFIKGAFMYHLKGGYNAFSFNKAYKYGLGFGAIFKKEIFHRKNYSYIFMYIIYLFRSLGGVLLRKNKKMYLGTLLGRIIGFIKYRA